MAVSKCKAHGCQKRLPVGRRSYCSDRCSNRAKSKRRRARLAAEKGAAINVPKARNAHTHGQTYKHLIESGLGRLLIDGLTTQPKVAEALGVTQASVSQALAGVRKYYAQQVSAEDWELTDEHRTMLLLEEPDVNDQDSFEAWLDAAVDAFVAFRTEMFRTPRGPYYTEDFHRKWIRATLKAIYTGGQVLILSPPRHGKSELLVHFCTWLILRNPNIQILWVSKAEDIAKIMVGMVKSQLEDNEKLRAAFLPPNHSWKPEGNSGTWRNDEFTVSTQDSTIVKSPTMVAVGRGGAILSRDADFIVSDDLEDHKSTLIPSARENTRTWFGQDLDSRKEEHTAWLTIGSHQHPDGLYVYMLDDDNWVVIEDSAHDYINCHKDPSDASLHTDCMLFPRLRSYRWLRKKQLSARALGREDRFDLVYLQRIHGSGHTVFDKDDLEAARDIRRTIGIRNLPDDYRLIAGLDPSSTGYQSAFLWAYSPKEMKMYMVDLDNTHGGGVVNALDLMKKWLKLYNCRNWVIEENGFQKAIRLDREVKEWSAYNGVWLEGHETQGGNKHDPEYGVGAGSGLYKAGKIVLPFAGTEAQEKVLAYHKQCLNFDAVTQRKTRRGIKSDILMASWFPMKQIWAWMEHDLTEEIDDEEYEEAFSTFEGYEYGVAPW